MPPRRRQFALPPPRPEDLEGTDELTAQVYKLLQENSIKAVQALIDLALGVRLAVPLQAEEGDEVDEGDLNLFHGHRVYTQPPDIKALTYYFDKLHGKPAPAKTPEEQTRGKRIEDDLAELRQLAAAQFDGSRYRVESLPQPPTIEGEVKELSPDDVEHGVTDSFPTEAVSGDVWALAVERLNR